MFLIVAIVGLALLACDAGTFTAMLSQATPTSTRTPRPTFTPRPQFTPTPEDTPTPEASPTTSATNTPIKPTAAPPKPATAKPPAQPTAPPQPQFEFKRVPGQGLCPTGSPVYEIKGRIQVGGKYTSGIHVVVLDKNGKLVAQTDSRGEIDLNPEWGVSCWAEKNLYNYQLDVSAGWYEGPLTLRLTRSATDLTPISYDEKISFDAAGGRYYIDWAK
jgi:hypothetical protein